MQFAKLLTAAPSFFAVYLRLGLSLLILPTPTFATSDCCTSVLTDTLSKQRKDPVNLPPSVKISNILSE